MITETMSRNPGLLLMIQSATFMDSMIKTSQIKLFKANKLLLNVTF